MSFAHTSITEEVLSYKAPDPPVQEFVPPKDRAFFADPEKKLKEVEVPDWYES